MNRLISNAAFNTFVLLLKIYNARGNELSTRTSANSILLVLSFINFNSSEGCEIVISSISNKIAISCRKYKLRGGKSNTVVYDDGLQLISPEERHEREQFYKKYKIGYVARPGTGRKGSFKKASNLNFGMNLGLEIERRVATGQGKLSYKAAMKQLKEVQSCHEAF